MDTIVNLVVTLPDSIAIVLTPNEAISHTCPAAMPTGNVVAICITVTICLLIIANAIWKCFNKAQDTTKHEIDRKYDMEKDERESEQKFKRMKDQYDSAWRTFEHMIKKELPENSKGTGAEAEEYLRYFWGKEISDKDSKPQK